MSNREEACEGEPGHEKNKRRELIKEVKDLLPTLHRIGSQDLFHYLSEARSQDRGCRQLAAKVLSSQPFDFMMGIVIVFNVVVMVLDIDRAASDESEDSDVYWTDICGWVVLAVFILELVGRLCVFQFAFWKDAWCVFDFLLVVTDTVFTLVGLIAGSLFPVSVLRIFRLAKLARVSKVLRVFPELRLLLASLVSSLSAIFWGACLLFLVMLVWSMTAVLFIHPLNKKIQYDEACERCPQAYSSVFHALLTFWQQIVAGDNWGQATIPVLEAHPITIPFFAGVFLTVGLAVLNLIVGVVVEVAQKAKALLEEEEHAEEALRKLKKQTVLIDYCKNLDQDKDGYVTKEEIQGSYQEEGPFRQCLESLEITTEDFDIVWEVMDADKRGKASYKDLVNYLCSMRSSDSQFMLAYIKYYITVVRNTLLEEMRQLKNIEDKAEEALEIEHHIEEECRRMEKREESLEQLLRQESAINKSLLLQVGSGQLPESAAATIHHQEVYVAQPATVDQSSALNRLNDLGKDVAVSRAQNSLPLLGSGDEAVPWNERFLHDLEAMRAEFKELLLRIDRKVSRQELCTI